MAVIKRALWFRAKRYGWGWYPCSWQGWLVLGIYTTYIFLSFYAIDSTSHSVSDMLIRFIPEMLSVTMILIAICWYKGETPKWRWGGDKKKII